MTQSITDFTDEQVSAVQSLANDRYGEDVELHLGDREVQFDPSAFLQGYTGRKTNTKH